MGIIASFPLFSEAGAKFVALAAAAVLIPSAVVIVLLDWIRRRRKPRDETDHD
jgi:hypothetical protein